MTNLYPGRVRANWVEPPPGRPSGAAVPIATREDNQIPHFFNDSESEFYPILNGNLYKRGGKQYQNTKKFYSVI